jgi:hypothetical protein
MGLPATRKTKAEVAALERVFKRATRPPRNWFVWDFVVLRRDDENRGNPPELLHEGRVVAESATAVHSKIIRGLGDMVTEEMIDNDEIVVQLRQFASDEVRQ